MKAKQGDMIQPGDKVRKRFFYEGIELLIVDRDVPYMYTTINMPIVISNTSGKELGCHGEKTLKALVDRQVEMIDRYRAVYGKKKTLSLLTEQVSKTP